MVPQPFKYYVVIDFEATNDENPNRPGYGRNPGLGYYDYPSEIIQFPAVLINGSTDEIVDTFNRYVRPVRNPILTRHILRLTHITQDQVDNADIFTDVLNQFENWLSRYSSEPFEDVCFVTDGNYDFDKYLDLQCHFSGIRRPVYTQSYLNIKEKFKVYYRRPRYENIRQMLSYLGMTFTGTGHNGLDDARNIAKVVQRMLNQTPLYKNA